MKALKNIIILGVLSTLVFSSCDNPLALGPKLDLEGPVVTITSPVPRKSVSAEFILEGKATDHSSVEKLKITASVDNIPFVKQWRYENGAWAISTDNGTSWQPYSEAQWSGTKNSVGWAVKIDLNIDGETAKDGEYTFAVQAWDSGNLSDDNSYRTIVLIVDQDPPTVDIISPYLYSRFSYNPVTNEFSSELAELHEIADDGNERKDPMYLGRFTTQEFPLQWQIDDDHDIWSIELFIYEYNANIDGYPQTPLPDTYVYRYYQNLPPVPERPDPQNYIKPNGSVEVPALDSPKGVYNGGILENPISGKTTLMVVAVCYDAAGHPNQEKNLGYFVYWPKANEPFIIYPGIMNECVPESFYGRNIEDIENDLYMVYPGKGIKANAFHPHGVEKVVYSIYQLEETDEKINEPAENAQPVTDMKDIVVYNQPRPNGAYSTSFPWDIRSLVRSGFYLLKAYAYDAKGDRNHEPYSAIFRVQDITFPDFPEPPTPVASKPLFESITNNTITIKGLVTDTAAISSLKMVWINPASRNYAAMSQLAYFRDVNYEGWAMAPSTPGHFAEESIYDTSGPNKVWNVVLSDPAFNNNTNRFEYEYSQTIELTEHLGIGPGPGQQPLSSQVFLLRAENPDKKCTIITYAPQGDTLTPSLKITEVRITKETKVIICEPGKYDVIEQFANNDVITINGTWDEDSTAFLDIHTYLAPNFIVTVNGYSLPLASIVIDPDVIDPETKTAVYGIPKKWTATMTVGAATIPADSLKDTLVIAAQVHDIGGNVVEAGSSWLIEGDYLRLMRISSEKPDDTYKSGEVIRIFLEFSKPVRLASATAQPRLTLNTGATAQYEQGTTQSTRHYFVYTVGNGDNANPLNVTGLSDAGNWQLDNYPFTWYRGTKGHSEYEEIRVTNVAAHQNNKPAGYDFYARNLPVTTDTDHDDYQFTLIAGKQIVIDTAQPYVTSILSNTNGGWYSTIGMDIYFTIKFNEPVKISSGTPRLILDVANNTSSADKLTDGGNLPLVPANIRVDGENIIFAYKIKSGDTTNGTVVRVTGLQNDSGVITDLAGNNISGSISGDIPGIYIDTITPGTPVASVRGPGTPNPTTVTNTVNGTSVSGISSTTEKDLKSLYHENLWLAIEGNTTNPSGAHKLNYLEYSIDNGTNWVRATNDTNNPLTRTGKYDVVARQIDNAGNVSAKTLLVSFTWDPGALVTRISSPNPNGTYKTGNNISITVTFRKPIRFSSTAVPPRIQLNATRGGNPITVEFTGTIPTDTTGVPSLVFSYTVQPGDAIPSNANLDVTSLSNFTNAVDVDGVNINNMIAVPTTDTARLGNNKQIKIDTVALTATAPVFTGGAGIQTDDGSYWTNLDIVFSKPIYKGAGEITITQNTANYRMPIILTEGQYNRFRNVDNINTYYTKGTNGYINGQGADTTSKYVLNYQYDPSGEATFRDAFRTAESVKISVAASIVSIVNNNTLRVTLEGANAPQVPGATYTVTYDGGLVVDALDNNCPTGNYTTVTLGGVAKPVIRIQKTQDRITAVTGSNNQPRLVATQPFQASVRMDCRTPGSTIHYLTNQAVTTTDAVNWSTGGNPTDTTNPATPGRPNDPQTTTTNRQRYTAALTIGTAGTYQGLQWYVRAKATSATGDTPAQTENLWSTDSEEMAYRTVITYQLRNGTNAITAGDGGVPLGSGDQIWIRGGDAIGSSSVPGFPFTWEDNWENLSGKRAGIRLMTKTNNTDQLNNSTWKFVTWDINTTAYIDMIMGRDLDEAGPPAYTASTPEVAWQYGPKRWAYQRAGWTSYKDKYPIYPGKHRWLDAGADHGSKGSINFSGTFSARPDKAVDGINMPTQ